MAEAPGEDKGTDEMNLDEDDPFGGAVTSEPEDDNDSDWLQEEDTDELRSESSIAESEMEDYFMRDDESEDDNARGTPGPGGRRKKNRRKRKRAEPFSGVKSQRKRRRKKTAATPSEMPPALKKLMGEATDAYLSGEFDRAVQILEDIVRQAPGLHDPFHLLGLIYEEAYGDKRRAVDFYLLAAHLVVPGDPELWRHIGSMSLQLGNLPQAVYCFRRCLRNARNARLSAACSAGFQPGVHLLPIEAGDEHPGPDEQSGGETEESGEDDSDVERKRESTKKGKEKPATMEEEVAFSLATCHQQMGDHHRAVSLLYTLLSFRPADFLLSRETARSLFRLRRVVEARQVLEAAVLPLLPRQLKEEITRQTPRPPSSSSSSSFSSSSFSSSSFSSSSSSSEARKSSFSSEQLVEEGAREDDTARTAVAEGRCGAEIHDSPKTASNASGESEGGADSGEESGSGLTAAWEGRMSLNPLQLDCVNLLAEVYRHLHEYQRCFLLLRFVTRGWIASQLPIDLLVKRAAAELFVGETSHSANVAEKMLRAAAIPPKRHPSSSSSSGSSMPLSSLETNDGGSRETPGDEGETAVNGEYVDLFLTLADAWAHASEYRRALHLYQAVANLPEVVTDTTVALKTANCLVKSGDLRGAADFLQRWLSQSEARRHQTAGVRDAEVRLLLCDVLKQLGQDLEADYTLLTISYKHLRERDKLPRAWSNADRERDLFDLQGQLDTLLSRPAQLSARSSAVSSPSASCSSSSSSSSVSDPFESLHETCRSSSRVPVDVHVPRFPPVDPPASLAHDPSTSDPAATTASRGTSPSFAEAAARSVANRFLALVQECELDTCRVLRQACRTRVALAQDPDAERFFAPSLPRGLAQGAGKAKPVSRGAHPGDAEGEAREESGESLSLLNMSKKGAAPGAGSAKVKDPNKALQHYKIKQHLGLRSIEDFVGLKGYFSFLCSGVELLRRQRRHEEAVSLLESILGNWRQKRPDGNDAQKREIKEELEILSITLSVEGQLSRTALASLRHLLQRRASNSRRGDTWQSLLEVYGRLLFTGRFAQQVSKALAVAREKDIFLENRSWTIRQLLQRPHNDALTLIVGHFCMLSSRWRFAVAEYTRAHCLRPWDPLPCLCLAVAYLCLSTSNKIQNKHDMVLRGFAMLGRYSQLRRQTAEGGGDVCPGESESDCRASRTLRVAETVYNLARAYHHVNLLHLAVPLYMRCLDLLDKHRDASNEAGGLSSPVSLGLSPPTQERGSGHACGSGGLSQTEAVSNSGSGAENSDASLQLDKTQIQKCAALNLIAIWRSQGGVAQARAVANRYLVWDAQ
ncbi:hypothetical protein NCLIV_057320 [Neospora caninum Liverpool]|nr:hypothetical protein NCLIV_057320 [Neospora caninum Liverpool]CBZ55309.1 hypothetical protein NCLIV_057320 [Neospora caninum Liverpool]|eukprot:XP_003885337.1 hypothetical protein NCLIV_057320 [Neospora caninum Liverpool]